MKEAEFSGRRVRHFLNCVARARKNKRPKQVFASEKNEIIRGRLGKIEDNIAEILDTQRAEAGAINELNNKITQDFQVTREELEAIERELEKLQKQSSALKNVPELQLNSIKRRISRVKNAVETLKK